MTQQRDRMPLFDTANFPVPARASSAPQVEAAALVAPRAGDQALRIIRVLQWAGPLTAEELAVETGYLRTSVCGRLWEMENPDKHRAAFLQGRPAVHKVGTKLGGRRVNIFLYDLTPFGKAL